MDDDGPAIRVATNTGGVDTGDTAPVPHTDPTIGDTNNPNGTRGVMPTGPSDDTHVAKSNTAVSPTLGQPDDDTHDINSDAAASPTLKETTASAIGTGDINMNDGASVSATPQTERKHGRRRGPGDASRKRKRSAIARHNRASPGATAGDDTGGGDMREGRGGGREGGVHDP